MNIGFNLAYDSFIHLGLIIFIILTTFDFLCGTIAASKTGKLASSAGKWGLIQKLGIFALLLVIILCIGFTEGTIIGYEWLSWIPIFFISAFIFNEVHSIFENYGVIYTNSKNKILFDTINKILTKIFGLSIEKFENYLCELAESKINKK